VFDNFLLSLLSPTIICKALLCIMNPYHLCLLLLLLLSAFLENPHYANLPNIFVSITAVESSSAQLGVLALGLPQNELFDGDRIIPAHNSGVQSWEIDGFPADFKSDFIFRGVCILTLADFELARVNPE
jgi:hypothetical protein